MKNQFNKLTQPIFEVFKGPRTKDYEFDKKVEEYKLAKEKMLTIKGIVENYAARLEGYNLTINTLISTCGIVFDRNQAGYCKFMNNVVGAYKAIIGKLRQLFSQMERLKEDLIKWNDQFNNVEARINEREAKRKDYEHYDEKMAELYEDRSNIIKKGKTPSDKDNEKYLRNVVKFQKAAKEYIEATNNAYKNMSLFLDARHENITLAIVGYIEIEAAFFNEAQYIFNYFRNIRNNAATLRNTFIPSNEQYNAENFIRGRHLLEMDPKEMFQKEGKMSGVILGKPEYKKLNNNSVNAGGMGMGYGQGGYGQSHYGAPGGGYNNINNMGQSYSPYGGGYGMGNNNNQGANPKSSFPGFNQDSSYGGDNQSNQQMINPFEGPGNIGNPGGPGNSGNNLNPYDVGDPINPYESATNPYDQGNKDNNNNDPKI